MFRGAVPRTPLIEVAIDVADRTLRAEGVDKAVPDDSVAPADLHVRDVRRPAAPRFMRGGGVRAVTRADC